jgi:WD40 repeat protein
MRIDAEDKALCEVVSFDPSNPNCSQTVAQRLTEISYLTTTPDGSRVVTGHKDGEIRFWSAESWLPILTLRDHNTDIIALRFSDDGSRFVSVSADGRVVVRQLSDSSNTTD